MGRRENKVINIEGRVQFDLLQVRENARQGLFTAKLSLKDHYSSHLSVIRPMLDPVGNHSLFFSCPLPGSLAGLQIALLHTERCQLSLPAGAEGRCAAFHHHGSTGNSWQSALVTDQLTFLMLIWQLLTLTIIFVSICCGINAVHLSYWSLVVCSSRGSSGC